MEIYDANTYPFKKLASTEYTFDSNTGGIVAIPFKSPAYLEAGKKYSFRLRSPLTTFDKAYRIGGWSKNCENSTYKATQTYPNTVCIYEKCYCKYGIVLPCDGSQQ